MGYVTARLPVMPKLPWRLVLAVTVLAGLAVLSFRTGWMLAGIWFRP